MKNEEVKVSVCATKALFWINLPLSPIGSDCIFESPRIEFKQNKMAIIIYNILKKGIEYVESGQDYYEQQYRDRVLKSLSLRAEKMGYSLIQTDVLSTT